MNLFCWKFLILIKLRIVFALPLFTCRLNFFSVIWETKLSSVTFRSRLRNYSLILRLVPCIVLEGEDRVIPETQHSQDNHCQIFSHSSCKSLEIVSHSKVFRSLDDGSKPSSVGTACKFCVLSASFFVVVSSEACKICSYFVQPFRSYSFSLILFSFFST